MTGDLVGPMLVAGGHVIDPSSRLDLLADVYIDDAVIQWVWPGDKGQRPEIPGDTRIVDATGLVVCPGFVDLHSHLREPGQEHKETIATGTSAAARGGFTTVCAMPNTNPPIDNPGLVGFITKRAGESGVVRVLPIATITTGRLGESLADLEELAAAGAVGFSDDGSAVVDPQVMRHALTLAKGLGIPVIQHCEDPAIVGGAIVHESWVSQRLGLAGAPAAAEETLAARDIELAALTGGRLHLAHISASGTPELIRRAKARGVHVTAEVMPHHLALSDEWLLGDRGADWPAGVQYDTNLRVNPPLRRPEDAEALADALREGVIDAVATDHAPHAWEDKAVPFGEAAPGISGIETAFGLLMTRLVHLGVIDLTTLIQKLTTGPASVLPPAVSNRFGLGTLHEGSAADIVILDPDAEWTVDPGEFASKGKNTPLAGCTMKGAVVATIAAGRIVHTAHGLSVGASVTA
jgi:dihydroorotase